MKGTEKTSVFIKSKSKADWEVLSQGFFFDVMCVGLFYFLEFLNRDFSYLCISGYKSVSDLLSEQVSSGIQSRLNMEEDYIKAYCQLVTVRTLRRADV